MREKYLNIYVQLQFSFDLSLFCSLDYLHGTGHGVGSYLNVHEEPIGISWKPHPDDPGLQPGMFLSNGISIKNRREIPFKMRTIR
jgi:Xaa-Pro aminopeptidase